MFYLYGAFPQLKHTFNSKLTDIWEEQEMLEEETQYWINKCVLSCGLKVEIEVTFWRFWESEFQSFRAMMANDLRRGRNVVQWVDLTRRT